MSNLSKRKRTNFTGSQTWSRHVKFNNDWHKAVCRSLERIYLSSMTEGFASSPTESSGSEDVGR